MYLSRIILILLSFAVLSACSSSGDDSPKEGINDDDPAKGEVVDEPKPFFQQNKQYSDQFIQNAIEENQDIRLQETLQNDKRDADRILQEAQRRLTSKNQEVVQLEKQIASKEALNGKKQAELDNLNLEKRTNERQIRQLNEYRNHQFGC